jgi:protein-tyrosine phosphatase
VADHNVPTLGLMLAFCEYTEQWMHQHQENVISVHCRGGAARWELDTQYWRALRSLSHPHPVYPRAHAGKGRSGTMICAWLLYSGLCPTAEDALHLFGSKRTDWSKGSKFQGVETQSQCRYIGYFEWCVNAHTAHTSRF